MSPKKSNKDIKGIETIEISSEDDETVKVKKQVTDVFTDETFPFPVNIWGTDMDNNVITFHQCSCEADWKDSSKIQNSILKIEQKEHGHFV